MNTTLIIPVHSFVDLITNSSSEIFVAADKNTVKAIKKLVEDIIKAVAKPVVDNNGNEVPVSADDLFTFDLVYECEDDEYNEVLMTAAEIKTKRKELAKIIDDQTGKYTAEEVEKAEAWNFRDGDDGDSYPVCQVRVQVKDKTNKAALAAAKVLSDLTGLFSIESTYG
jgi:hypothetical protein